MNPQMKTKSVLGYKLTLVAGHGYVASRPMLEGEIDDDVLVKLPVMIQAHNNPFGDAVAYVDNMPYDKANDFLNAFNNGKYTFDGRIW